MERMVRKLMAVAALCAMAGACNDIPGGPSDGRTRVLLTDAPFPYDMVAEVHLYVARIDVSEQPDTSDGASSWVTIATPQRAFDLLALQGGSTALLGEADLPAAQYAAVRMVINTSRSSIVRHDGTVVPVQWPVADELTLYALVEQPLYVGERGADIVLDFDVGRSFVLVAGAPDYFVFIPVVRAVNAAATGDIRGTVTWNPQPALPNWTPANTAIEVRRETPGSASPIGILAATGRTNAAGEYLIPFLSGGGYRVYAFAPGVSWRLASASIAVVPGQASTLNLVVGPDSTGTGGGDTTTFGPGTGPVASVIMNPVYQRTRVGDSLIVLATPVDTQGQPVNGLTASWSLSDTTVLSATWRLGGWIIFRTLKAGDVQVTATYPSTVVLPSGTVSAIARVEVQ
jgi:hypothetical protein